MLYRYYSSLEVAAEYFRSGADKISIGSDAVYAAEEYLKTKVLGYPLKFYYADFYISGIYVAWFSIKVKTGKSSLEQISRVYGNQVRVIITHRFMPFVL